jgi:inorganic pyrophosphatase
MNYVNLPLGDHAPQIVNAVVEVPAGQANKYEYDEKLQVFRLDRPLFASVHYPGDYGFIPSTRSSDGDPLDILILVQEPTFPGCLVQVRPVAALAMLDQGVHDEKVLAVAQSSPVHQSIHNHTDLAPHVLREVEHFFLVYKQLEGKETQPKGWRDAARAHELIQSSHARFHCA